MDIISLLPSPSDLLRNTLSLLNSSVIGSTRRSSDVRPSPLLFDVNLESGFFPSHPLPNLPEDYAQWEHALESAHDILHLAEDDSDDALDSRPAGETWRENIRSWPVLSTEILSYNLRLQQRAHFVLSWLVHFYVHSMPPATDGTPAHVPAALAVPLVEISRTLGMAPILTFADTVLWNFELIDPAQPVSINNIRPVHLFSGTEDERNFYHTSAAAELRGVELLRIIDDYHNMRNVADLASVSRISRALARVAVIVEEISDIIQSVRAVVDPHVFYWEIRPWFEGSDAKGPDEPGWVYEGVAAGAQGLDLSGPSAGQSSVMHALDIFLDVDHKLHTRRAPAPSPENKRADHGFMERMRRYMPGRHRAYLAHLAATPRPLREVARRTAGLKEGYDAVVMALKKLRDLHMRIAVLYIVTMSRTTPLSMTGCPVAAAMERMQARKAAGQGPVRGTGGNELSLLLKAGRDATRRAVLKDN